MVLIIAQPKELQEDGRFTESAPLSATKAGVGRQATEVLLMGGEAWGGGACNCYRAALAGQRHTAGHSLPMSELKSFRYCYRIRTTFLR